MFYKKYVFSGVLVCLTTLTGCSSTPQEQNAKLQEKIEEKQVKAIDRQIGNIPSWFLDYAASDDKGVYAVGSSVADDFQVALDDARTLALSEIASKTAVSMSQQKALQQKKGTNAKTENSSSLITDEFVSKLNLAGYQVVKREVKPEGKHVRAYVMVFFPNVKSSQVDLGALQSDHAALLKRVEQEQMKTIDLTPNQSSN